MTPPGREPDRAGDLKFAARSIYATYWLKIYPKRTEIWREAFGRAMTSEGAMWGGNHKKKARRSASALAKMDKE